MSLIHGSRGLIYFVHQFEPEFSEASLLEDADLLSGVTAINRQIHELAPVLNSPTVTDAVKITSSDPEVPLATMCKRHDGATYVFTVCMRNRPAHGTIELIGSRSNADVHVLGEDRSLQLGDGRFQDDFAPYSVHLYRVTESD